MADERDRQLARSYQHRFLLSALLGLEGRAPDEIKNKSQARAGRLSWAWRQRILWQNISHIYDAGGAAKIPGIGGLERRAKQSAPRPPTIRFHLNLRSLHRRRRGRR
jgi:hypothetical protein